MSLSVAIEPGTVICYYTGCHHNYHSSKMLKDRSYLLYIDDDILVDPLPTPEIKARYINDPLNEVLMNVKYVPEPSKYRCAVVATCRIDIGDELFVSYGDHYWSQQHFHGNVLCLHKKLQGR